MAKRKSKPKFGRGINALLSSIDTQADENKEEVVKELASNFAMLPITQIERNPDQPRQEFGEVALQELTDSIKIHGVIQPITVRRMGEDRYQIISGERRFRASKAAKLDEVPAFIRLANDQTLLEMALIENIQRKDLNPIEIATAYQRLIEECSLTHQDLSDRVGKNRTTVTNYLRLLKLPDKVYQGVKNGTISMGQARPLLGVKDIAVQLAIFDEIVHKGLSARQIEALVKQYGAKSQAPKKSASALPMAFQRVKTDLTSHFGVKVDLKLKKNGRGQIVLNFKDTDQLNALLDKIENRD